MRWLMVEELAGVAFRTPRIVMANDVHNGSVRVRRTRRVGRRLVARPLGGER